MISSNNTLRKRSQCHLLSNQGRTIIDWPAFLMLSVEPSNAGLESGKRGCEFSSNYNRQKSKTRLEGLEDVLSGQLEIHSRNLKNVLLHLEEKHKIRV